MNGCAIRLRTATLLLHGCSLGIAGCGDGDNPPSMVSSAEAPTTGAMAPASSAGTTSSSAGGQATAGAVSKATGRAGPAANTAGAAAQPTQASEAGAVASAGAAAASAAASGSGAVAGSGVDGAAGATAAAAGSSSGMPETPPEACDPADQGPEAMAVSGIGTGMPPTGEYKPIVETDPGLEGFTIFRPETLGMIQHPVFTWGNGGCMRNVSGFSEFLLQIAAEGIVVIADGGVGMSGSSAADGSQLVKAMDWAEKENARPCSKYYRKLDVTKMAVSGQSCGGLMALNSSDDKRIATSMPMNSGLMARDQTLYAALHAPMAIINGGESDIAYANGNADFEAISNIPIMNANLPVGHGGTYREDNGGEMGKMARAWLRWHLLNDEGATGKGMFIGDACGFCSSEWTIEWKMKPQ